MSTYIYDNEDIILEYLRKGDSRHNREEVVRFTHGPGIDEPISMERKKKLYYYHFDGLGSVTELTNQRQRTIARYDYDSFGNPKHYGSITKNPYAFTGREYDPETGLYFYRNRYYDSRAGRFITQDPMGMITGPNLYTYVNNNPVNLTDPLGLASIKSRPLEGWAGEVGKLRHEQIFFDDGKDLEGKPTINPNIGFFNDNTIRPDKQENLSKYARTIQSGLDDDLMRQAVLMVKSQWSLEYRLFGHQCQDFIKAVRQEYGKLKGEKIKEK